MIVQEATPIDLMLGAIEAIVAAAEANKTMIKNMMIDKSFTLDDRWSIFTAASKANLLDTVDWGDGLLNVIDDNMTPYDDCYIERYQTVEYIYLYDTLKYNNIAQEKLDAWREAVLESGYQAFKYD